MLHKIIYHITTKAENQANMPITAESLETEGFIHCSYLHQVLRSANKWFKPNSNLYLLEIETDKLTSKVVSEDLTNSGTEFPHIYGTINPDSIVRWLTLEYSHQVGYLLPDIL